MIVRFNPEPEELRRIHVGPLGTHMEGFAALLVRLAVYALRHIFAPSGWLHTSERFIAILIWSAVALHLTGFLPEILQAMDVNLS